MPSDYQRICAKNIREYGRGSRHLSFLGRLYSDRTHFLFELLQNAEDAGATFVRFSLAHQVLSFEHNGRVFNTKDVRGICGVDESTKQDDLTKIGKFGIGFKAVYAYTTKPEIHSGNEAFEIHTFVRPQAVLPIQLPSDVTTLFRFPLGTDDVTPEQAFDEIYEGLARLGSSTLLFLGSIQQISWTDDRGRGGSLSRVVETRSPGQLVKLHRATGRKAEVENWWLFTSDPLERKVRVQVAFRLDAEAERICRSGSYPFVVTFPTEKETSLGFLLNGRYQTTPARDNIPRDSDWNKYLLSETGEFLVSVVKRLARLGRLRVDFLEALLPEDGRPLANDHVCEPLLQRIAQMLREDPVLPGHMGGYHAAGTLWMATKALREFLAADTLSALLGAEARWLSGQVHPLRTPGLYKFLRSVVKIKELSDSAFAAKLDDAFLKTRSDAWMESFYGFLLKHRSLWTRARDETEKDGPLLKRPFLRLNDSTHVRPFRKDGTPRAYLPTSSRSQLPIVSRKVLRSPEALKFLEKLGLLQADLIAEVLEVILPQYETAAARGAVSRSKHRMNLGTILEALALREDPRWGALVARLRRTRFLKVKHSVTGEAEFKAADAVYVRTPELANYFHQGSFAAWFLDEPPAAAAIDLLAEVLGVATSPRFRECSSALSESTKQDLRAGEKSTEDISVADFQLDGFAALLTRGRPTMKHRQASVYIWNDLARRLAADGLPEQHGTYSWRYWRVYSACFPAQWLKQARSSKWLPKTDSARLHAPGTLEMDDLPEGFVRSDGLRTLLGMQGDEVIELARKLGIEPDLLALLKKNQEAKEVLRKFARATPAPSSRGSRKAAPELRPGSYGAHLELAFPNASSASGDGELVVKGDVQNPGHRRNVVKGELAQSWQEEPDRDSRARPVIRREWEARDPAVREFLRVQYDGRCQICDFGFSKRDGNPYFETIWLTEVGQGQWTDQPGNALCLCANCAARFLHGSQIRDGWLEKIRSWKTRKEGGKVDPALALALCGQPCTIRYTEKHFMSLQELVAFEPAEQTARL